MKVVIIGGVAGGATTAARLRRLDESAEIVILERGSFISYANCGLPYFVGGTIADREDLELQTPASFNARFAVDVRARAEAVKIDIAAKTVTVRNLDTGEETAESYDNLVIAPGASANVPDYVPQDDERVFTLRTIPDAVRIKDYVLTKKPKTAVVVGGGFIGLEVAENLIDCGLDVTLVGRAPHVLPNIDTDVAWDVHRHLKKNGLKLKCGVSLNGVRKGENRLIVETAAGNLETDLLVMAAGIKPDTGIVADAGIRPCGLPQTVSMRSATLLRLMSFSAEAARMSRWPGRQTGRHALSPTGSPGFPLSIRGASVRLSSSSLTKRLPPPA